MKHAFLAIAALLCADLATAAERSGLFGACFVRSSEAAHPAQRVGVIAVQFQGFADSLLAGITYKLRYGTTFSFSADCSEEIAGGFLCRACGSGSCQDSGETFEVLWSGGDTLQLVNEATGFFARNAAGGRDRVQPGGEHAVFELTRRAPEDCSL